MSTTSTSQSIHSRSKPTASTPRSSTGSCSRLRSQGTGTSADNNLNELVRHSPRNRAVAEVLQHGQLGTLLLDLLTEDEDRTDAATAEFRFDIPLLADRLVGVIDWAQAHPQTSPLAVGVFGASTAAAAALIAAARRSQIVRAVVSRGGRPDMAEESLDVVAAPTLLIVGGRDDVVIELNKQAFARLKGTRDLQIVLGATHLFEEPGALDRVSQLAKNWFEQYLD